MLPSAAPIPSARREGKIDMTQQLDESGNTEPSMFLATVTEKAGK